MSGSESDEGATETEAARHDADDQLAESCTRFLQHRGRVRPRRFLDEIGSLGDELSADTYGEGGVVAELERRVADLLGMPAACFMVSGTMAQQIALRVHADRRGSRVVAFHPTCHLELHEDKAYQRLQGLVARLVGDAEELMSVADLAAVAEPLAALLIELPQREIGGVLPVWDDLVALTAAARQRGAALHLDGARLWESAPFYDRPLPDIAGLFDSVYVSFYKGLGGLAGCCLAGQDDLVREAREWRRRYGGTLSSLWPNAAAALVGLRERLPRMPEYVAHARAIAEALRGLDGVAVRPDPPQTTMMHLHLRTGADAFAGAVRRLATERKVWVGRPRSAPSSTPGWRRMELTVGDATLELTADEVRDVVAALVAPTPAA